MRARYREDVGAAVEERPVYGGEEAECGQATVEQPSDVEPPLRVVVRPRLPVQHVREQHAQQQHVDVAPQLRVGGVGRGRSNGVTRCKTSGSQQNESFRQSLF